MHKMHGLMQEAEIQRLDPSTSRRSGASQPTVCGSNPPHTALPGEVPRITTSTWQEKSFYGWASLLSILSLRATRWSKAQEMIPF